MVARPALIWLLVAAFAMGVDAQDERAPSGIQLGTHEPSSTRYTLAVPSDYDAERSVPLILALHFGGEVTPYYGRIILETLIEPALRPLGALVVAPDCAYGAWAHPQCEAGVLSVLDQVEGEFTIDRTRTLITGYSRGGIGTWELGARHPDRFRAAVVMAGRPPGSDIGESWGIPVHVLHARDDELMPVAQTVIFVEALQRRGTPVKLEILDGVTHFETHRFLDPLRAALPWIVEQWRR